ncbi:Transposable element Tc1 transposase, partial [Eumeta japonica]
MLRKKPLVSLINRQKRIAFAEEHINKPEDFWKKVLFSDESKYCIFGIKGRQLVWRKPCTALNPKNLKPTVKHGGGGVMVWGCMSSKGVGNLEFIESTMDHRAYLDILKRNLPESVRKLGIQDDYIFQQDNDPKHTAYNTKLWLLYNVKTAKTPPQSQTLNPIEHLWDLLERRIRNHVQPQMLKSVLVEEWNNISSEY